MRNKKLQAVRIQDFRIHKKYISSVTHNINR